MKKTEQEPQEARFTKEQLLSSRSFAHERDLLGALLADDEQYTAAQAHGLIEEFKKGMVK